MSSTIDRITHFTLPRPKLAEHMFTSESLLNSPSIAEREFLEISQKTPMERLREKILQDMKTSEEQIAQMEPEERQAVEDEIQRRLKEALGGDAMPLGAQVDKSA